MTKSDLTCKITDMFRMSHRPQFGMRVKLAVRDCPGA
jgi:hypothetical protein